MGYGHFPVFCARHDQHGLMAYQAAVTRRIEELLAGRELVPDVDDCSFVVTITNPDHHDQIATLKIYEITKGLMDKQREFMAEHLIPANGNCTIRGFDSMSPKEAAGNGDLFDYLLSAVVALDDNKTAIMAKIIEYSLDDGMTLEYLHDHIESNIEIAKKTFQHAPPRLKGTFVDPLRNVPDNFYIPPIFMKMITTLENIPINPGEEFMEWFCEYAKEFLGIAQMNRVHIMLFDWGDSNPWNNTREDEGLNKAQTNNTYILPEE